MQDSRREFDELDVMWRETGATVNPGVLAGFGHMLDVLDGHPSRGIAKLAELREELEAVGDRDAVVNIDMFTATVQSRLATGEVVGAAVPPASLRDKAFIKTHRVGASKKGRRRSRASSRRCWPTKGRTDDWQQSSSSWPRSRSTTGETTTLELASDGATAPC